MRHNTLSGMLTGGGCTSISTCSRAASSRLATRQPPDDPAKFDIWNPANISPLVAWLATEGCPASGKVFFVQGGKVQNFQPWTLADAIEKDDRWTVAELQTEMKKLLG